MAMASKKKNNSTPFKDKIASAVDAVKNAILGTYEGECADAMITNKNGMDITRPVWENVFNSDDYAQAIKLGWYIGFLGHPEDPNCMDFEHACIVMTEGHIDADGKVYGKFNLIDTPVGRVVKAFQDAGVTFGISVRGAGDIIDNSVDPDTFVFRGFDLVTFPAFPESIPKFTEIAASTNVETQKKYQRVCAAVESNLSNIEDIKALEVIQSQFAKQSKQYAEIEARKKEIDPDYVSNTDDETSEEELIDENLESITAQRLNGMTQLYLEASEECSRLAAENESLKREQSRSAVESARKLKAVKRITADQLASAGYASASIENSNKTLVAANRRLKAELEKVTQENLKYNQKISISASTIKEKDQIISGLRQKLDETVNVASDAEARTSNLDAQLRKSNSEIVATRKLLASYQQAYAKLYANAVGANLTDVEISAATSVAEMQKIISGTSLHSGKSPVLASRNIAYEEVDIVDDYDADGLIIT